MCGREGGRAGVCECERVHVCCCTRVGDGLARVRARALTRRPRTLARLLPRSLAVMLKLLKEFEMFDAVRKFGVSGMPCFGTCAGCIMMSKSIDVDKV